MCVTLSVELCYRGECFFHYLFVLRVILIVVFVFVLSMNCVCVSVLYLFSASVFPKVLCCVA